MENYQKKKKILLPPINLESFLYTLKDYTLPNQNFNHTEIFVYKSLTLTNYINMSKKKEKRDQRVFPSRPPTIGLTFISEDTLL